MHNLFDGIRLYLGKTARFQANARLVLIYSAITGLSFGVFRFLFNFYVLSLGTNFDETFIGLLQTTSSFAAIAIALPAAYVAERFSQKRIMVVTSLASAIAILGLVLFPYKGLLLLFQMAVGTMMSLRQVAIAPFLMANTSEDERQWVFSFNFGLITMSNFFGNLLAGWLPSWLGGLFNAAPTDTLSYQLAMGSMMLVSLLSVGPISMIKIKPHKAKRTIELPWVQLKQQGSSLLRYFVPQLIIGLGAGMMMPFMNIYFRKVYDQPDQTVSLVFAVGGLSMAVAQFLGPPLAERMGKLKAVIFTQLLSVPFLLTLSIGAYLVAVAGLPGGFWFLIAGAAYVFRLALMNLSNPIYQTFVLEHVPEKSQALAMSLNSLSFQFGWFIMPQISGWLQVRYPGSGFVVIFASVAVFYLAAIAIEWALFIRKRQEQPVKIPAP